ncbi:MAG: cohesin domain-containing protein [bacterium]
MNNTQQNSRFGRFRCELQVIPFLGPGYIWCLLLLVVGIVSPALGQDAVLSFDPDDGVFETCDSLVVNLLIDDTITDLRGFSIVLEFDSAVVEPTTVTAGALLSGAACDNFLYWINYCSIADSISVDGATLGCSVSGPGAIVRMVFLLKGIGVSPLSVRQSRLRTGLNQPIPHTCEEATMTSNCPVADTRYRWGQVKAMYR